MDTDPGILQILSFSLSLNWCFSCAQVFLSVVFGNPAEGLVCGDCGNSYLIDAENPEIIDGKGVLGRKVRMDSEG
jgi:hypothetical protein